MKEKITININNSLSNKIISNGIDNGLKNDEFENKMIECNDKSNKETKMYINFNLDDNHEDFK